MDFGFGDSYFKPFRLDNKIFHQPFTPTPKESLLEILQTE